MECKQVRFRFVCTHAVQSESVLFIYSTRKKVVCTKSAKSDLHGRAVWSDCIFYLYSQLLLTLCKQKRKEIADADRQTTVHLFYLVEIQGRIQKHKMSRNIRKCTFRHVRPVKIQTSLCKCSLVRIFTGPNLAKLRCKVSSCREWRQWVIRLHWCTGWFESSLGAHVSRYIFSYWSSNKYVSENKIIATDKRGYPHNIFLISRWKHMLWVLIRSTSVRRF